MTNPSARIVRVDAPVASPGHCGICGKSEHPDGFADARLDFEFYGTLYFCADCVGEYARLFNYMSPKDYEAMRTHIEAQGVELNTLRQAVLGLESTVDSLIADAHRRSNVRLDRLIGVDVDPGPPSDPGRPVDQPNEEPAKPDVAGPVKPAGKADNVPAQSSVEQGPNDLYDTSAADELLGL